MFVSYVFDKAQLKIKILLFFKNFEDLLYKLKDMVLTLKY